MECERNYDDLFYNDGLNFNLMRDTSNALLLQFRKPIVYDLTIPNPANIRRLLRIFQDDLEGEIVNPSEVDCCFLIFAGLGIVKS